MAVLSHRGSVLSGCCGLSAASRAGTPLRSGLWAARLGVLGRTDMRPPFLHRCRGRWSAPVMQSWGVVCRAGTRRLFGLSFVTCTAGLRTPWGTAAVVEGRTRQGAPCPASSTGQTRHGTNRRRHAGNSRRRHGQHLALQDAGPQGVWGSCRGVPPSCPHSGITPQTEPPQ